MKNENKILERAEIYLRKLSSGLNPLDDTVLAETDVCRQERVGKCLLYVADYLRRQVNAAPGFAPAAAEGAAKQKKQKTPREQRALATKELVLDAETLVKFEFSDEPVSVSSVVRGVNALLPAGNEMMPLMYADIAEMLCQAGILEKQSGDRGRETNLPTAQGEVLGFTKAEAEIRGRHAVFTKCNRNAQQYILNNIEKCVAQANDRLAKRLANAQNPAAAPGAADAVPARAPRAKFSLSAEELQKYPVDEIAVPVTEIARRLNDLLPVGSNIQQIYFKAIRDWFVSNGYLEESRNVVGKVSFAPTESGRAAGIVTESRVGKNGESYEAVLYGGAAQKLVLEHVNEMC